jgi:putative drug exporter of the RND superfamily
VLKLARWSTTHRLYVVVGWIVLIAVVNALGSAAGTEYSNNFTLPNSDAQRAADLLQRSFPAQAGDPDQIVFRVEHGTVLEPGVRERMSAAFARVKRLPHVAAVISPYEGHASGKAVSADRTIAFATVVFDEKANLVPESAAKRVVEVARAAAVSNPAHPLEVELGGQAIELTEREGFGLSTAVGLMAAIVVLLITFGSLLAMGLPIVTAVSGLGTGLGLIALFTHVVDTADFSSELAAMIGLGVGIDYSLFILTRFREAHAGPGPTHGLVRESVAQAMDTAGRAVLFAGTTVVIALLGMMLLGVSFLYGVAVAASIAVLLVMLASLTLLPALLTLVGGRLTKPSRFTRKPAAAGTGAWLRWSAFVQRRPRAIALGGTLVMLLIAAPATALRLGSSDAANDPPATTTHRAYTLLAKGFGEGFSGPLQVVVRLPRRGDATALRELDGTLSGTAGVASVAQPRLNPAGEVATLSVYPRSAPEAYATTTLVKDLRERVIPPVEARTGAAVYVGGVTAGSVDFAALLARKLPIFIGVVVLLSALLLMVVFRSLVIPLQAAVMNLLSIGASLGVIVALFQWGWLPWLLGVSPGPIESFVPVMLFAIVFGLSMDYEVFLVSRIHEQWTRTDDHRRAVGEGLALTGRVVTAAAAIMVCVFLSFVLGEARVIKEFGLALASAVFIDALVVRCLLLPAVLNIVGPATWRIPAWLDRVLPRVNIEGTIVAPPAGGENELLGTGTARAVEHDLVL